jgi:hypothetical protein
MKIKYVLDGNELTGSADTQRATLGRCPVTCTIAVTDQEQEVHGFRQEDDFKRWVGGQPFAAKVEETDELVTKSREYESRDHRRVLERQQILNQRTVDDLSELAQESGFSLTSRELLDLAHRGVPPMEPPILHSAVLYDNSPLGAVVFILPTGIPVPTFGGNNDRASQLDVVGVVTTLWDRTWWRGDRQVFYGVGFFTLFNSNFDNRAASGTCL